MGNLAVRRILELAEGEVRVRFAVPGGDEQVVRLRTALLESLAPEFQPQTLWTNWIGDEKASALVQAQPRSLDELVRLVGRAVEEGMSVRAVGAGHSTSPAARPDDLLIDMGALSGARRPRWLRSGVDGDHNRRVLAGTRVKTLNRKLLDGLALPNMGSFDWQTVAGALSTGTHGSSVHTGPMAEGVRSVDMVVVERRDGEPRACAYRIEPAGGITDPGAFRRARAIHGMELIQDDDVFFSSVVSFGAVGVIYAMTLELVDSFWLEEEFFVRRWSELRPLLEPKPVPGFDTPLPPLVVQNDFVEFLVNGVDAQLPEGRDPLCLVRRRNRVSPSRAGDLEPGESWPPRRTETKPLQRLAEELVPAPNPELDPHARIGGAFARGLADAINGDFQGRVGEAPFKAGSHRSVSHVVLRRERDATGPEEEPDPPPQAISSEIAVPLERTVEAVDDVLAVLASGPYFYPVPFGVRFVAPSAHYLAPQHGRFTTMIEVPLLVPSQPGSSGAGAADPNLAERLSAMLDVAAGPLDEWIREQATPRDEAIAGYKEALERIEVALCYAPGAVGGRPHWGQYHTLDGDRLRQVGYPHLSRFEAVRRRFDPAGAFQNRHTRQLDMED